MYTCCNSLARGNIYHARCSVLDRFSRVECPLKSVQYQFAPMFMTVVFNPLAPGSGTGRAINLRGVPLCRGTGQDFQPVRPGETSSPDHWPWSINFLLLLFCWIFFTPSPRPSGWPPNYRRRLWQTARALFESSYPRPIHPNPATASCCSSIPEQPIFTFFFSFLPPRQPVKPVISAIEYWVQSFVR